LAGLRERLARKRTTAPLFDAERFRRHLEGAYATMVERSARGEMPAAFTVAAR
jgi:predicted O-linked N-acetylglucosamine transferase (SPINDLY family)